MCSPKEVLTVKRLFYSIDALRCFTSLEKFTDLRLNDTVGHVTNPLCNSALYKTDVVALLPRLLILDGRSTL